MVGECLAQRCPTWGQSLSIPRDAWSEMRLSGPRHPQSWAHPSERCRRRAGTHGVTYTELPRESSELPKP